MEEQLASLDRKVLADIVKLAQKRGMKGTKGIWKEFLNAHDRQLGAAVSDPYKRTKDILVAFLNSLTDSNDQKFLMKVLQCHLNRRLMETLKQESPDNESLEQRLVRLTIEHAQYPIDYSFPSYEEDWIVTKLSKKSKRMKSTAMVAIDCEMVLCQDGTEALVRVCVVDRDLQVKLNELVKPDRAIADYRSDITGVSAEDLAGVNCSLADVQKSLRKILAHGTILVGHGLNNDLKALKLDHSRIVDTSYIFKYPGEHSHLRPSLNNLCKSVLGCEVRKTGAPHNCLDDACAAMKIVLALIERGIDNDKLCVQVDVSNCEKGNLFIHRIPVSVPIEELRRAIPGEYILEAKPPKNANADKYSALAIFKRSKEAHTTFESLEGSLEKDSFGREQKLITLQSNSGTFANFYVREVVRGPVESQASEKKRVATDKLVSEESKRPKIEKDECKDDLEEIERLKQDLSQKDLLLKNGCEGHLKEIEQLKQALSQKDFEISVLHKIVKQLKDQAGKKNKKGS